MDEKMTKWRWLFLGLVITHHMTDGLDENIWTRNNISEPELKIICHLPCCGAAGISLESRPFWKYLYLMPWQEMSPALVFEGMKPMQSKHITVKQWRKVLEFRHETLFTGLSVKSVFEACSDILERIGLVLAWVSSLLTLTSVHNRCQEAGEQLALGCVNIISTLCPPSSVVSHQLTVRVGLSWARRSMLWMSPGLCACSLTTWYCRNNR